MHINFVVCVFVGKLNVVMSLADRKLNGHDRRIFCQNN